MANLKANRLLVIDEEGLGAIGSAFIEKEWFSSYEWPYQERGLRRVKIDYIVYLLTENADEKSKLLVINVGPGGVLENTDNPQSVLDRIVHVTLSRFERTVSIPINWHVYHDGSRLSVYRSIRSAKDIDRRLYFDQCPRETEHVYCYAASTSRDFGSVDEQISLFDHAMAGYIEAATTPVSGADPGAGGAYGVTLTPPTGAEIVGTATLEQWYEKKLTQQQRVFVDKAYSDPVRLRGAAGTGKTLSMAVKLLRDAYRAEDRQEPLRFAFLTHSAAVAHETVPSMLDALDRNGRWRRLKHASVFIGSVYELAQELLQYDQKKLNPLSTDGRDGREFQAIEVVAAIGRLKKKPKFQLKDIQSTSDAVRVNILASEMDPRFVSMLMNEIACVLDAENVRLGSASGERYVGASRERWQMDLPLEADRRVVLQIHDEYRSELEKSDILSMDQMVADFNSYLGMHEWSRLRDRLGYDAIFVDELHYFNRAERMIFHNLFTRSATSDGRMPLFMSYDLKQSPTDSFMGSGASESAATFFAKLGAGESKLVELTEVFRSTPQITRFINDLDAAFPALDLEGEWGTYEGRSEQGEGDLPELHIYDDSVDLLDKVFEKAGRDANKYGGKNVAVICMNDDMYGRYLKVGRINGKFVELSGRDQTAELRYAGKKCVFTMPEYVAGLQFDSVYIIHADKAELDEAATIGERRRFVSRLYLAASRAKTSLQIAAAEDRGGYSRALENPILKGSLRTA